MTIDEAVAKATRELDSVMESNLSEFAQVLRRHGATDEELRTNIEWQRGEMTAARDRILTELRAWLARGGETLQ